MEVAVPCDSVGDLHYSFGGTAEEPLIRRTVRFSGDPKGTTQEQCLERADVLLQDLCHLFDDHLAVLDTDTHPTDDEGIIAEHGARGRALDIVVATLDYAVTTCILPCPSVKYVTMYVRAQEIMRRMPLIQSLFGDRAVQDVQHILQPLWTILVTVCGMFGKPSVVC
jgi:hypothetical protein